MIRVEVTRHVPANVASVALLLAEPPAEDGDDRGWVVEPPHRSGISFTALIEASPSSRMTASGQVTAEPAVDSGCDVRLAVTIANESDSGRVERSASKFLSQLAARAKSRSRAA